MARLRLDKLLFARGLVPSRERAQALVLAGRVLVNDQKADKPGTAVDETCSLRLLGSDQPYVSRGGLKLAAALQHWSIPIAGNTCLDVGASTGGFTDCLLQHGAARVLAVDTGYGQFDAKLRSDPRIVLLEKTNARYLAAEQVRHCLSSPVDFLAVDVSFISATLVLPAVVAAVREAASASGRGAKSHGDAAAASGPRLRLEAVVLVKPQFEAGREQVGKGGIVRDTAVQQAAVVKVRATMAGLGFESLEVIDSPILGTEGNKEFLLHGIYDE